MNEKQEFTHVKIEKNLAEALIHYLASKPLGETVELWNELRQSKPIIEEES